MKHYKSSNKVHTCIAHGDTHGNNVFVLVDADNQMQNVALIDWGKVRSASHPLTDIAILLANLVFRVQPGDGAPKEARIKWAHKLYRDFAAPFNDVEAIAVFILNICRMLAWRNSDENTSPWFNTKARTIAWKLIRGRLNGIDVPLFSM